MPEGIFPRYEPRPTSSHAEKALYRELKRQLPAGWCAWHSLRLRTQRGNDGEGDFVIAIPNRGVLVIEVKGGAVEVRDGQWRQNGHLMRKVPRDQALSFRGKLLARFGEKGIDVKPGIEIATAFPDTAFSKPPSQGDLDNAVLGQQDLPYLADALLAMAERLFARPLRCRDKRWIKVLHDLWCETWTPALRLGDRSKMRDEELVALEEEQLSLLDCFDQNPRMLVRGGAGTGKTLVASEIVRRLAARDHKPLMLCSTRALATGLRASGIEHASTVREYAAKLLEQAEVPLQGGKPPSQWSSETWELAPLLAAVDALPKLDLAHDALVVDEGQDMSDNDWDLIEALAGDGMLWIFADEGQGFWVDRKVRTSLVPATFFLKKRYRCPEPLACFADLYRPAELVAGEAADDAGPNASSKATPNAASVEALEALLPLEALRIARAPAVSAIEKKVAAEIDKAIAGGLEPSDIAVLTLPGQARSIFANAKRIGRHDVVRADAVDVGERVIADTFLRFKGLERPWIIVTELYLSPRRYEVRMYVALTRATLGAVVVATGEQVGEDWRLVGVG